MVSVKMKLICIKLTKELSSIIVEPIFKFILEKGFGEAQAGLRLTMQLKVTMSPRSFLFHLPSDGIPNIPTQFFICLGRIILNSIWKNEKLRITKTILYKRTARGITILGFTFHYRVKGIKIA